jgi:hypothetical protein
MLISAVEMPPYNVLYFDFACVFSPFSLPCGALDINFLRIPLASWDSFLFTATFHCIRYPAPSLFYVLLLSLNMVSLSQKHPTLQQGMSRSHSSATLTSSTKKSPPNNMAASDPDLAKQLFKANVKLAIDDRVHGSSTKFDELAAKFRAAETSPIEISQYLTALIHFVTYKPFSLCRRD